MSELKNIMFESNPYHNVVLRDRTLLEISGVKQIEHFDEDEFLLESVKGWMEVKGKDLTLDKLDKERGEVVIKGTIEGVSYITSHKGSKEPLFSRLFK